MKISGVKSDELNSKKNLCFHFQSGHLAKLGGKLKTWRKRWFDLKNGVLTYWKSQHDVNRKPQGQIMLDEQCRISKADGASTFEINTGKKVYYLTADSIATMDDWIRVLQNVQRRNATKLLLSRDDQKATVQGWVTRRHLFINYNILRPKVFMTAIQNIGNESKKWSCKEVLVCFARENVSLL